MGGMKLTTAGVDLLEGYVAEAVKDPTRTEGMLKAARALDIPDAEFLRMVERGARKSGERSSPREGN